MNLELDKMKKGEEEFVFPSPRILRKWLIVILGLFFDRLHNRVGYFLEPLGHRRFSAFLEEKGSGNKFPRD
jgi:hypothetical protein